MDAHSFTDHLVLLFLEVLYLLLVSLEAVAQEWLAVEFVGVDGAHASLDIRVDCHHLHELCVETNQRPEPEGHVQGVGARGDQRKMGEIEGYEHGSAGCDGEEGEQPQALEKAIVESIGLGDMFGLSKQLRT